MVLRPLHEGTGAQEAPTHPHDRGAKKEQGYLVIDAESYLEIERVVKSVVQKHRGKARSYGVDVSDLLQHGLEVAVERLPFYDPERGVPLGAYVRGITERVVLRQLLKEGAPVSGYHKALKGLRGVALDAPSHEDEERDTNIADAQLLSEQDERLLPPEYQDLDRDAAVRLRLERIFDDESAASFYLTIFADGVASAAVQFCEDPYELRLCAAKARRRMERDPVLRRLADLEDK